MKSVRSTIQRQRFPLDTMFVCRRWYNAYASSLRNLKHVMEERSMFVQGGEA
jgi:transposase-like protein